MFRTTTPRVLLSNERDALVYQGPELPSLLFTSEAIARWRTLREPASPLFIESRNAVALVAVMFAASARLSVLKELPPASKGDELCLCFNFGTGLKVGLFSSDELVAHNTDWCTQNHYHLVVGPTRRLFCSQGAHLFADFILATCAVSRAHRSSKAGCQRALVAPVPDLLALVEAAIDQLNSI
jgi:hypothetical protein